MSIPGRAAAFLSISNNNHPLFHSPDPAELNEYRCWYNPTLPGRRCYLGRIRCVLDLQVAQNESRHGGLGRYSRGFARALASEAGEHEVWVLLSGLMPDSVEPIRAFFDGLIPQERIVVFSAPAPVSFHSEANDWRMRAAERLREAFIANLAPDLVYLPSLIEGFNDNLVASINTLSSAFPTVVSLHDLSPLLHPDVYLRDPRAETWYLRKLQTLKAADLILATSGSTRRDAIDGLSIPEDKVITIRSGIDACFRPMEAAALDKAPIPQRYGITRPFLVCPDAAGSSHGIEDLISGFSLLPQDLRAGYQLLVLGGNDAGRQKELEDCARKLGLLGDEVVFACCTADDELVALYNLCSLVVLPACHQDGGIRAVEAMACGAPTLGANVGSIPEVLGRLEALFDPYRPASLADRLHEALANKDFRESLRTSGLKQAQQFTWESSACKALETFEEVALRRRAADVASSVVVPHGRPLLAYVSPLPPQQSGISDYSAELLPELAQHYEIEVVVQPAEVSDPWITANFPVRDVEYFSANSAKYDRVLYHFGNSPFHSFMFDLLDRQPGTVVLHDFYLGDLINWMEWQEPRPHGFLRELYASHGYDAIEFERREGRKAAIERYPCNRQALNKAAGVIIHSQYSRMLAENWYGVGAAADWRQIPVLGTGRMSSRVDARNRLGLTTDSFLVCCFGLLTPAKLNDRLVAAWLRSELALKSGCQLVFVGQEGYRDYEKQLNNLVAASGVDNRIRITGFAAPELYRDYLSAADIAVQLRTQSRGETSKAVVDCMIHGIPTIVNAHGSLSELPEGVVARIPDSFEDSQLTAELERMYNDVDYRQMMAISALRHVRTIHHPAKIASLYRDAIEDFAHHHPRMRESRLIHSVASMASTVACEDRDLSMTAYAIAAQCSPFGPRQLLLDVSATAREDLKTGIQRVARHTLTEVIRNPPVGFQPETVHDVDGSYTYGRRFTLAMLGRDPFIADDPVEVRSGDVFLGLDLCTDVVPRERHFFEDLRARNIPIYFVVFDLLPILRPEMFPQDASAQFRGWLDALCEFATGLVCISRSVADELLAWLEAEQPARLRPLKIGYFHLGADISESVSTKGFPAGADVVLSAMRARPSVIMVGTIEPRKGHAQALAAFERLWAGGFQGNLVVVGHQGWHVESLTERMCNHPERGKRFFWLPDASDEMLSQVYSSATALLAASVGEGFGLPLIEAARHRVAIIARDIPVFREVAGEHAFYFKGESADSLASSLREWFDLHSRGLAPSPEGLKWLSWKESAQQLMEVALGPRIYRTWLPSRQRETSSGRNIDPSPKDSLSEWQGVT